MTFYVANAIEAERAAIAFGAICPGTGRIIGIAADDDTAPADADLPKGLLARCPHCHTQHELPASALFRLPVRNS